MKKANKGQKNLTVEMQEQINLNEITFISIPIDKSKFYIKKSPSKYENINIPPYTQNDTFVSAKNTLCLAWGKDVEEGESNLKKVFAKIKLLQKYFTESYDLNKQLSDAINLVIEEKNVKNHHLFIKEMKNHILIRKKLYTSLIEYLPIKDAWESRWLLIESIENPEIFNQVENNLEQLLNNTDINQLSALIQGCQKTQIRSGKKGRRLGLLHFILPYLTNIWNEGAIHKKLQSSRIKGSGINSYKGGFYEFIMVFNSILKIKDKNLSLGTSSTIGKITDEYLKKHR